MSRFQPLRALALASALTFGLSAAALAHAHLVSSTPAADDMAMPAPKALTLKFSEGIELKFTKVTVTGPNKAAVVTGPLSLDAKDPTLLTVPLPDALPDGDYTVDWNALSTDGHKSKGSYHFSAMPQ